MQLRNKYYSYPVIIDGGEYYDGSSFSSELRQSMDGYNIKLNITTKLTDKKMRQMIDNGEVVYAYHIECSQTCYRRIIKTQDEQIDIILRDVDVNGVVQVCAFVVAEKNLEDYSNESFSEDYQGFKFNLDRGCILAVGNQFKIIVNKVQDDLENKSSIFTIVPNKDQQEDNVLVDMGQNKIIIKLPDKTYHKYKSVQKDMYKQPVMHSMVIVPALVYVFSELQRSEDLDEWEDHRWFRALRKSCASLGISLDSEQILKMDFFRTAQQLLKSPFAMAIEYTVGGEDDDED